MNTQLRQVHHWMQLHARTVRNVPPTGIPSIERYTQTERLVDALWAVSQHLGMNPGRPPTIITTGENISPPHVMLSVLTKLYVEVCATCHMTGLGANVSEGVYQLCRRGPTEASPDWKVIVDPVGMEDDAY